MSDDTRTPAAPTEPPRPEDAITIPASRLQRLFDAIEAASDANFDDADAAAVPLAPDAFGALEEGMRAFFHMLQTAWEESEAAVEALERSRTDLEEKLLTIERQQLAIRDLSAPVIDIWEDVVTLPIVGTFDTERALEMTERLLQRIVTRSARCVIIDLTGVDVVDSMTADHLIRMTKAAQLLGTFCVVTGIGPDVARTLVDLGVDLGNLTTVRNLKEGLRTCLSYLEDQRVYAYHNQRVGPGY
jgi:rsbT co-antagonist protein RsbR